MGKPQHILNSQANAVFGAIARAGLDPSDFEWRETALTDWSSGIGDDYMTDMLIYRSPETFFAFGRNDVLYSPGYQKLRDEVSTTGRGWDQTFECVNNWLRNIKREATPSLWERIAESTRVSAGTLDAPDTRFTTAEQTEILARLDAMARQIAALDALTREQKQLLGIELGNIGNAAKRMDRGEWLRFAIGGMMAVLLSSDLQHSVAASLMRWAVSMFQSAVTGGPAHPLLLTP